MDNAMVMEYFTTTKEESTVEIGSKVKCMVMVLYTMLMEELLIKVNGTLILQKEKEFCIIKMSKNLMKDLIIEISNWENKFGFHIMAVL